MIALFLESEFFPIKRLSFFLLLDGAEFYAVWNGCSKLGIVTAWINSNLKLEPLAHSSRRLYKVNHDNNLVNVANCPAVILSKSLYPAFKAASSRGLFKRALKVYSVDQLDNQDSIIELPKLLSDSSEPSPPTEVSFKDVLCYIYTSGTTGNREIYN